MTDQQLTFVTVAYAGDTGPMTLQARSLALYAPRQLVAAIIVVENDADGGPMAWRPRLLENYGHLADLVIFKKASEIAVLPAGTAGWWSQQILKLEIARQIETPVYMLLDGKHHLCQTLERSFVYDESGRLRIRCADYNGHPLADYLDRALAYFGLRPEDHRQYFPTTTPPIPMDTAAVLKLIDRIEADDTSLAAFMISQRLTEFFLYWAFLTATNRIDELYERHEMAYPMIWPGQHDDATCQRQFDVSISGESPFFGLHRKAIPLLSPNARTLMAGFWTRCGLFETQSAAEAYLQEQIQLAPSPVAKLIARLKRRIKRMAKPTSS